MRLSHVSILKCNFYFEYVMFVGGGDLYSHSFELKRFFVPVGVSYVRFKN